ncbi:YDG domain-containing protein [Paenibacillus antarcticus]|uniref:SLH domain-containing protein n=1 Tax=Paenibacillus antarcticus TaxID=253703 RepID=A0A168J7I1_9BACL|nr:YDG domain-containing protein [Paenibacillus antarcticus]OAB40249.1 hypothetical protein PBAT_23345 [Paenibacillus antarcticus]
MRYTRNFLSTLLIIVMLFSSFNVAFGATESSKSDIKGTWAETQISNWMDKGFIKGYQDGSFQPNNTVTRAEFFAMINRSFGFIETANVSFSDLTSSNWASSEVSKAVKAGYITGYADGTIGVLNAISRQEVAVIVDRLLGLTNTQSAATTFTDSSLIASWAKASVQAAVAKDILKGYADDNSFKPNKFITRAEAVVTLDRAIIANATKYSTAGTYGPTTGIETINGDVIITVSGVTLQNIIITGNILFDAGIEEGDAFLKNVSIKGVTRVEGGGVNSIYLKNSDIPTLIVDKKKGDVRIVVEGSTIVGDATIKSPTTMQEKDTSGSGFSKVTLSELLPAGSKVTLIGVFDSLNIKGRQIQVNIPEGSVKEVTASSSATGMTLTLGKDAKIISLVLDAVAKILGTGTIEKVTLSSVAKNGTTIEITIRMLDRVNNTSTPTATSTGGSNTAPSTGGPDITAPMLSNVTIGQISLGDDVHGTSNESGYLYLVPSTTTKTLADLNQSVTDSLGNKLSVTANVESTISTAGLALGTYVVYAVDGANNISTPSAEIVMNRKQLSIADPSASLTAVKMYDGTASAAVTASPLIGVVSGDDVTLNAIATYDNSVIGTNKTITIVYTLSGVNAANYIAPVSYNVNTGVITAAQLTIGDPVLTLVETPVGDSSIIVNVGTLVGVVEGEAVTVSAEATYSESLDKARPLNVIYIIAGDDSSNYIAPASNTNYNVYVQSSVDTGIMLDLITNSKVYDGTILAVVSAGSRTGSCVEIGICPGDDATVNASGTYNDKSVGTNKSITVSYTLSGDDSGNYYPPASITVNTGIITAKQLTIAAPTLTLSKVYDGSTTAVVTPGALTNVISGDDVQVQAVATYKDSAVGTNKVITIVYTLTGADAGNYIAPVNYTISTGVISAR